MMKKSITLQADLFFDMSENTPEPTQVSFSNLARPSPGLPKGMITRPFQEHKVHSYLGSLVSTHATHLKNLSFRRINTTKVSGRRADRHQSLESPTNRLNTEDEIFEMCEQVNHAEKTCTRKASLMSLVNSAGNETNYENMDRDNPTGWCRFTMKFFKDFYVKSLPIILLRIHNFTLHFLPLFFTKSINNT